MGSDPTGTTGIDAADRRIWLVIPKSSSLGKCLRDPVAIGSQVLRHLPNFQFLISNYPKTGCNPRKIQDLRAFSDSY